MLLRYLPSYPSTTLSHALPSLRPPTTSACTQQSSPSQSAHTTTTLSLQMHGALAALVRARVTATHNSASRDAAERAHRTAHPRRVVPAACVHSSIPVVLPPLCPQLACSLCPPLPPLPAVAATAHCAHFTADTATVSPRTSPSADASTPTGAHTRTRAEWRGGCGGGRRRRDSAAHTHHARAHIVKVRSCAPDCHYRPLTRTHTEGAVIEAGGTHTSGVHTPLHLPSPCCPPRPASRPASQHHHTQRAAHCARHARTHSNT